MDRMPDVTPGEILSEEFLLPMSITAYRLGIQDEYDLRMELRRIFEDSKKIPHTIAY